MRRALQYLLFQGNLAKGRKEVRELCDVGKRTTAVSTGTQYLISKDTRRRRRVSTEDKFAQLVIAY